MPTYRCMFRFGSVIRCVRNVSVHEPIRNPNFAEQQRCVGKDEQSTSWLRILYGENGKKGGDGDGALQLKELNVANGGGTGAGHGSAAKVQSVKSDGSVPEGEEKKKQGGKDDDGPVSGGDGNADNVFDMMESDVTDFDVCDYASMVITGLIAKRCIRAIEFATSLSGKVRRFVGNVKAIKGDVQEIRGKSDKPSLSQSPSPPTTQTPSPSPTQPPHTPSRSPPLPPPSTALSALDVLLHFPIPWPVDSFIDVKLNKEKSTHKIVVREVATRAPFLTLHRLPSRFYTLEEIENSIEEGMMKIKIPHRKVTPPIEVIHCTPEHGVDKKDDRRN